MDNMGSTFRMGQGEGGNTSAWVRVSTLAWARAKVKATRPARTAARNPPTNNVDFASDAELPRAQNVEFRVPKCRCRVQIVEFRVPKCRCRAQNVDAGSIQDLECLFTDNVDFASDAELPRAQNVEFRVYSGPQMSMQGPLRT